MKKEFSRKVTKLRLLKSIILLLATLLFSFWLPSYTFAKQQEIELEDAKSEMSKDKSGTNPVNFTFDARLYNEYIWLNTGGNGNQNLTTFEFKAPFAEGKWQFRVRGRYNMLSADLSGDGSDDVDESGLGDIDFRFLTVPYVNLQKKWRLQLGWRHF